MSDENFDQDAWLARIGHRGARVPNLDTLQALVAAHSSAIAYESIDVLLDRPPRLDLRSLQDKMIAGGRGGYCFEQNMLFRGALRSLGYQVASLQARVVRGLEIEAPRPMFHMVLRVDLPEGPFLADVGFGNLAPTAPLRLSPAIEQATSHEPMRFIAMGDELTLQSRLGDRWEHVYRVVLLPRFDAEYEICNWFSGTHPDSPYLNNMIAARPGPDAAHAVQRPLQCAARLRQGRTSDARRRGRLSCRVARWLRHRAVRPGLADRARECRAAGNARAAPSVLRVNGPYPHASE